MAQDVFNWCFIGAGRLASIVAREILPSGRHRIASVYARRPENCRRFAERVGAMACRTAEEAMTVPGVDGVYVVTPHNSHFDYTRLALELGKPVLCEKPFTVNAEQTAELIRLAREKDIYMAEAMWTWFGPVARQVKRWVDAGEFGRIRTVRANYHMNIRRGAPRLTDPNLAGGALLDIGIYPVAYLYRLFGNPVDIRCTGTLAGGVDLREDVEMTFTNGITGIASASMADFRGLETLKLIGEDASLKLPFFHAAKKAKLKRKKGPAEIFTGDGRYLNEFDCVLREIREGRKESRYVPQQSTLDVMRILDECRKQMGLEYPFEKM